MNRSILFIVGPTASGKTACAIREALARDAVILSCDSLCFYKGMDIGTAKPTLSEQEQVPHYGIDLVPSSEAYSVAKYIDYRDKLLEQLYAEGRPVIVAGGSGFYLKSFFSAVVDEQEIPQSVSKHVADISRTEGLDGLVRELKSIHPPDEAFEELDLRNPRRIEKALIRCLQTGKSYSELLESFRQLPVPLADWEKEVWLIERDQDVLQSRNRIRVKMMLEAGLVAETIRLREEGFEKNPSACRAIGYRETLEFLDGKLSPEELEEQIFVHTNQLMRKQRTWFRKQIPVDRVLDMD